MDNRHISNYWENDILYLTGMGLTGDQTLSSQNKTLSESDSNNVTLHLFENNARNSYIYEGGCYISWSDY